MTKFRAVALGTLITTGLALALMVAACGGGDSGRSVALGMPFDLEVGETIVIEQTPLRLRFERVIQDSRCPVDVTCIRAGDVTLLFTIMSEADREDSMEVRLGEGADGTAFFDPYRLTVREVAPQPRSTAPIEGADYVATVIVEMS